MNGGETDRRLIGDRVRRVEDLRFITGTGQYADDLQLAGMCDMVMVRSPYASARVLSIDTSEALASRGVIAVLTAAQLGEANREMGLRAHPGVVHGRNHSVLAVDRVRYVGEPVAAVIADNRYLARDAADLVFVDYDPSEPVASLGAALMDDAPLVHADVPGNTAGRFSQSVGDVEEAFRRARHVLRRRLEIDRGSAHPMETRSVVAYPEQDGVTIRTGTQIPHRLRDTLAPRLGLQPEQVRIIPPDTGGSFGVKAYAYPEEVLVPWVALQIGRPVKWVELRREHTMATFPERAQSFEASLALNEDGTIAAIDVSFDHDLGAYMPYGYVVPQNTANHIIGPYVIPTARIAWQGIYTNLTPTATYRGAGRPQGVFVIERMMDLAAAELGVDPIEIRRRNLIRPEQQPYDTGLETPIGRLVYDSGDYPAAMDLAVAKLPYADWRDRQKMFRAEGRMVGMGVANYVEFSVTDPFEGATVEVAEDGSITVATGASQQGQGYETVFAQVCGEAFDVPLEQIRVFAGDTTRIARGAGNYGSRVAIMTGSAVTIASKRVVDQAMDLAAETLEIDPADLVWRQGMAQAKGVPGVGMTLADLARIGLDSGRPLQETSYFEAAGLHAANGTHAAVVEIDSETGMISFHRYIIVHDCGRMLNPSLVEGQILGGVAQGIGGCLSERLLYSEDGQPLTTSFMDYLLPTAADMPEVEIYHLETHSPHNPLGVKGAGEGGILPVYAVLAAAVEDATGSPVEKVPLSMEAIRRLASIV